MTEVTGNIESEKKEDFLEVYKPIPGQNFACMSFVSPEKVIASKELFKTHAFMKSFLKDKYSMTESQWKEEYDNFVSAHEEKIEQDPEFNEPIPELENPE